MVKTLEHTLPSQCAKFISEAGFPVRVKDTGRHINISEDQKAGSLFSDLSGHTHLDIHIRCGKKGAQRKGKYAFYSCELPTVCV